MNNLISEGKESFSEERASNMRSNEFPEAKLKVLYEENFPGKINMYWCQEKEREMSVCYD